MKKKTVRGNSSKTSPAAKQKKTKSTPPKGAEATKATKRSEPSPAEEPEEVNAISELDDALTEVWDEAIQPVCDLFIEWEEKFDSNNMNDAQAMELGTKILEAITASAKKAKEILD